MVHAGCAFVVGVYPCRTNVRFVYGPRDGMLALVILSYEVVVRLGPGGMGGGRGNHLCRRDQVADFAARLVIFPTDK